VHGDGFDPALILGRPIQNDHPTKTRAMSSEPKLPFAGEPSSVETSSESSQGNNAPSGDGDVAPAGRSRARVWLRRVGVLLFVFLCATLGVMLMILPWRPEWTDNPLLLSFPALREVFATGFVRGAVTGLGLLNVWIGFWEAMQYRED
jgi:hypothetical protein